MKANALLKEYQTALGTEAIVTHGDVVVDFERMPSGVFTFDLATGGGWPKGKLSICYGPEASGKTNICYLTIALFQKMNPKETAVFVDVEQSYDKTWARRLGIDTERLIVIKPQYGEQAVDMTEKFLREATDAGLFVIDSLAMMEPAKDLANSAEIMQVAGNAALIKRLIMKVNYALALNAAAGRFPTVIAINQIRYKVGQNYGNPESQPGGMAPKHAAGLAVRMFGKSVVEKEIHAAMPAYQETSFILKKTKIPITAITGTYKMSLFPHGGHPIGYIEDWNTLSTRLKNLEWLVKTKTGWQLLDLEPVKLLKDVKARIYGDPQLETGLKGEIISLAVAEAYGEGPEELNPAQND